MEFPNSTTQAQKCCQQNTEITIAICGICGNPICSQCRVFLFGKSYCKSCAEERQLIPASSICQPGPTTPTVKQPTQATLEYQESRLGTPFEWTQPPTTLAGLGTRFLDFCIDAFILLTAFILIYGFFGFFQEQILLRSLLVDQFPESAFYPIWILRWMIPIWILICILYFLIGGAEPTGKRFTRLRIINLDGTPVSRPKALLCAFCYLASALPLFLGFLWMAWDKNKQVFHDKLTNTYVIVVR